MNTNKNNEKNGEEIPAWMPTPAELNDYALEVEARMWDDWAFAEYGESPRPTPASRSRELRWFIDEHLEWAGWSFEKLAAHALEHGLFDARRHTVASAASALAKVAEKMCGEALAA